MIKRKKSNLTVGESSSSFENSSFITNLELDNRALKAKNVTLVQDNAKLQLEKAQQQVKIMQLQEDLFKINSCFVNLKNILITIDSTTKGIFPKFLECSEMFSKITQLCAVGTTVSSNRDPRTLTVQPHTVNGHVIQHPTIALSRMTNDTEVSLRRSQQNSSNRRESDRNANQNRMSTESNELFNHNSEEEANEYNMDVDRGVHRRRGNIAVQPLNMDEIRDEVEDEIDDENLNNDEDYCTRLFTIQEENESPLNRTNSFSTIISREVKIFIDRLPSDYVRRHFPCVIKSPNNSTLVPSSKSMNPNNSSSSHSRNEAKENGSTVMENSFDANPKAITQNDVYDTFKRREARYFGEPSSYLQPSTAVGTDLEISNNISAIHKEPSCSISHALDEDWEPHNMSTESRCSKKDLFSTLGLEPFNSKLTTSTPVNLSHRMRSRNMDNSSAVSDSETPVKKIKPALSKVNKRSRVSEAKSKIPQVVLNRMSLEKRLSGSPVKKINDKLKVPIITKASQITQRRRQNFSSDSSSSSSAGESEGKENVDTSNRNGTQSMNQLSAGRSSNENSTIRDTKKIRRRNIKILSSSSSDTSSDDTTRVNDILGRNSTKDRESRANSEESSKISTSKKAKETVNRVKPFPPIASPKKFGRSPRPMRKAKPTTLQEPKLNKKMRRSK